MRREFSRARYLEHAKATRISIDQRLSFETARRRATGHSYPNGLSARRRYQIERSGIWLGAQCIEVGVCPYTGSPKPPQEYPSGALGSAPQPNEVRGRIGEVLSFVEATRLLVTLA